MTDECKHPSAVLSDENEPATYHCPDCGENFVDPTDDLWQAAITRIKEAYFPKVVKEIFDPIRQLAENDGCVCSPVEETTDDEYKWSFIVHTKKVPQTDAGTWHPTALGVDFTILESTVTDGNKQGIAFKLDFQGNAGRMYNTLCPMNLTEALWVQIDDDGGISDRFADLAIYAVETFNAALEELRRNIEDGELAEAIAEWKEQNESRPLFEQRES